MKPHIYNWSLLFIFRMPYNSAERKANENRRWEFEYKFFEICSKPFSHQFSCYHQCKHAGMLGHFRHAQLFTTLWTVAGQAPMSVGFSRQEYCSRLPFSSPGGLANPGIEPASPMSPAQRLDSLPLHHRKVGPSPGSNHHEQMTYSSNSAGSSH